MTRDHTMRVSTAKKGILLRETSFRDKSGGRRWGSGGDAGCKEDGG